MKTGSRLSLAAFSGLTLWTGFAPLEIWVFPIIGVATLFIALSDTVLKIRLTTAFVAGIFFFSPLLHWSSVYVGAIPWIILSSGQALLFAAIGLMNVNKNLTGAAKFAAVFTLQELLRMKFPFGGFGWGRLGFTQLDSINVIYPIIGITGVSFAAAFLGSLTSLSRRNAIFGITFIGISFLTNLTTSQASKSAETFELTAVQGGVGELGLDYNSRALDILKRHVAASSGTASTSLVLWPENAVDVDPSFNPIAKKILANFLGNQQGFLMTGVVENSFQGPKNSSIVYNNEGEEYSRYVKQDLAPFGEYMPLRWIAERISPYAKQVNDFVAGNQWSPVSISGWKFQSFICFEILDDDLVKQGAQDMDFLIAQTNNATFGESSQSHQQLQITRARAAELGKEFAVVSTTGITAHLAKNGQVIEALPQFEPGALKMAMERSTGETPASYLSTSIWLFFCVLIVLVSRYRYSR